MVHTIISERERQLDVHMVIIVQLVECPIGPPKIRIELYPVESGRMLEPGVRIIVGPIAVTVRGDR